ncbi:hypothetical protein DFJ58DRAFT_842061 [Suillus subalutaceus]|uniref:uncharacterized protein n=1 Tax=Suillus subalutaceus TaxID=48586 RepID=UPI001B88717F|nr:uncharacterized protein DFJ58DRAFT_842061 [Suillus subalutaceus]KAG1851893.1 hypothetical protein DFJ58DRAFT_842061 [Suillus subalutaceus]
MPKTNKCCFNRKAIQRRHLSCFGILSKGLTGAAGSYGLKPLKFQATSPPLKLFFPLPLCPWPLLFPPLEFGCLDELFFPGESASRVVINKSSFGVTFEGPNQPGVFSKGQRLVGRLRDLHPRHMNCFSCIPLKDKKKSDVRWESHNDLVDMRSKFKVKDALTNQMLRKILPTGTSHTLLQNVPWNLLEHSNDS